MKTEIKNCFSAYRYNIMQWKETNQVVRDAFIKDGSRINILVIIIFTLHPVAPKVSL